MAYVYFLMICVIWGSNFLLMKKALLAFGPVGVASLRVLGGALILGGVWLVANRHWPLERQYWRPMGVIVVLGYLWPFTTQPYLIGKYGSGFVGMMVCLVPLMTIAVSIPLLHVLPTRRQLLGVLGGFFCLGFILYDGSLRNVAAADLAIALSVPLLYAFCNAYIKRRFMGLSPLALSFSALLITGGLLLPPAAGMTISERFPSERLLVDDSFPVAVAAALLLGIVGTGLSQLWFMKLVQEQGPLFAGMVTYLIPTIAVGWAWIEGERVTLPQLAALGGVLLMVAVVQYRAAGASLPAQPPPSQRPVP